MTTTRTPFPSPATTTAAGRRIAAAAVVVVARDGFDVLSVRGVAREAGVTGGTVQHHYPTRAALLLGAFGHTVDTISERLAGIDLRGPVHQVVLELCSQALPLDEQRRQECIVWAALSAAAASHPDLAVQHAAALDALTAVLTDLIGSARDAGQLATSTDPAAVAAVLAAVVDGLTLHGITGTRTAQHLVSALHTAISHLLRTSPA